MRTSDNTPRLAQSASALGGALAGIGIGGLWGGALSEEILYLTFLLGAIIHISGMYVLQLKSESATGIGRILWITAWVCLLALIGMFLFLTLR